MREPFYSALVALCLLSAVVAFNIAAHGQFVAERRASSLATALVQAHIHELQNTAWIEYRARMLELERTALGDCFCGPSAGFCDEGRVR